MADFQVIQEIKKQAALVAIEAQRFRDISTFKRLQNFRLQSSLETEGEMYRQNQSVKKNSKCCDTTKKPKLFKE